jgi:hypothetical protein
MDIHLLRGGGSEKQVIRKRWMGNRCGHAYCLDRRDCYRHVNCWNGAMTRRARHIPSRLFKLAWLPLAILPWAILVIVVKDAFSE